MRCSVSVAKIPRTHTAPRGVRNLRVGFVFAPGGVRIEMVQGRTEEELVASSNHC